MITWLQHKEFIFGKDSPNTTLIETVSKIFEYAVQEGKTAQEACEKFIQRIATHTFQVPCVDLTIQQFVTDCICGPGAFSWLTANNSNVVDGITIKDFTPRQVELENYMVDVTIGRYTGCKNANVYATCYLLFENSIIGMTGTVSIIDRLKSLLGQKSSESYIRIMQAITLLCNDGVVQAKEMDDLDEMFPKVKLDETEMRLRYVCKGIPDTEPNKYKALVIKYLDIIESAVMEEANKAC